jgi:surface antigen
VDGLPVKRISVAEVSMKLPGLVMIAVLSAWLDRADRACAQNATYTTLEHNPTGTVSTWRNPDTANYAAPMPTRTYKTAERDCRDYEQTVIVDGREEIITAPRLRSPMAPGGPCDRRRSLIGFRSPRLSGR